MGDTEATAGATDEPSRTVLVIEDEPPLAGLLNAVLADEGYRVELLHRPSEDAVRVAVGRLEPDCILLDGEEPGDFGRSWLDAAWAHERTRPVPVIMFTADAQAAAEGQARATERSRAANFFAVVAKPFDIDALLGVVERATASAPGFDRSTPAERERTAALAGKLEAAGATDIHASTRREWVSFYAGERLSVVYWSQRDGVYYVTRQAPVGEGGSMLQVGRFHDLDLAVELAVAPAGGGSA